MRKLAFLFVVIFLLCACTPRISTPLPVVPESPSVPQAPAMPNKPVPQLKVTVLKLGKADSILLELSGKTMLIDAGEEDDGSRVAALLRDRGITRLDYVLVTHLDKDHVGGMARVISEFPIGTLLQSHNTETSEAYTSYRSAAKENGIVPIQLRIDQTFSLGGAQVHLLPCQRETYDDDNDYSVITELTYGTHRFLFAGDAEKVRLTEYLASNPAPFDFIKMPHHGTANDMSKAFIQAVAPKYAVITCSKKNEPDYTILNLLKEVGAKVYLTADGYVEATSDGVNLEVKQY